MSFVAIMTIEDEYIVVLLFLLSLGALLFITKTRGCGQQYSYSYSMTTVHEKAT